MDLDTPLDSAGTTGSIASRGQLPDRFDDKIHSGNPKVNPASAKNPEDFSGDLKLSLTTDRKTAQKESLLSQVKTLFESK